MLARRLPKTGLIVIDTSSEMPEVDIWLSAKRTLVWYWLPTETRQASALESLSAR